MHTEGQEAKAKFRAELDLAGLSQADLRHILGVSAVTVNRWYRERDGARPVPGYAMAYLRAWNLLPAEAKALLLNDARR